MNKRLINDLISGRGLLTCAALTLAMPCLPAAADAAKPSSVPAPETWVGDLTPINQADWSYDRAAHLLERAGFGGTPEEIEKLAAMKPADAVKHLVRYQEVKNVEMPTFDPSPFFPSKDFVPPPSYGPGIRYAMQTGKGEIWGIKFERKAGTPWLQEIVDHGYHLRFANNGEIARIARWEAQRMLITKRPLEEKLALFWHGHFATENDKVRDYRKMMAQWDLYRAQGNRNFKDLLLGICKDPAMTIYLDGQQNVKGAPNENFSREILELFSLGDGNYTERDIKEAARAFTGWGLKGNVFHKYPEKHDDDPKTIFGKTGNFDGEDVVELILDQPACARFMTRKLYRYFVREELSPELNEQLAEVLRKNKYEIAPLLEAMLLSRDFYSPASYATQVKAPVHLIVSTYKKLGLTEVPSAPNFQGTCKGLDQQMFLPPNVAGWKGGRTWINPSTMLERQNFARYVLFPRDIPRPTRRPMDFVADIVGQGPYEQMNEMAKKGDYTSFPTSNVDESGFQRREGAGGSNETYNIFRGVYNGGIKTFKILKTDPPTPAKLDLASMVKNAGVKDASGAVDYFMKRFLRLAPQDSDRAELVRFLSTRLGGDAIDFSRKETERDLREVLHLILSLSEYQVA